MLGYTIGLPELLIVLVIVLLLFGSRKLPELARSLGKSSKEFKEGMREGHRDEERTEESSEDRKPRVPPD